MRTQRACKQKRQCLLHVSIYDAVTEGLWVPVHPNYQTVDGQKFQTYSVIGMIAKRIE